MIFLASHGSQKYEYKSLFKRQDVRHIFLYMPLANFHYTLVSNAKHN